MPGISTATQVAAGRSHSCALLSDQTVRCWGDGSSGQLGNGATVSSATPVQVTGITTATQIAAGENRTCALLASGSVMCWGSNADGGLGDGTTTARSSPVAVVGIANARQVTVNAHVCAALTDLTARCWGVNNWRQLGDQGTESYSAVPVSVTGITAVIDQISAGGGHTCLRRSDASAACWGLNNLGQLGTGDVTNRRTPTTVSGLQNVLAVGAGVYFSCALLTDRTVRCWGDNLSGNLGNGTTQGSLVPVTVLIGEAPPPPPLEITTASLPTGTVGQSYSQPLAASGGNAPRWWTVDTGELPPGIGLSAAGALAGTPTSTGTYTFSAKVSDSSPPPLTATRSFTVTVSAPPPAAPDPPLLDNFNRTENPVSQAGKWASAGITGGAAARTSQNRLQSFPSPSGGYSFRVLSYLGNDMEAAATVVTRPNTSHHLSVFVCLQSAGTPGWDGYELRGKVLSGTDLWEIRRVTNGVATVLASKSLEIAANGTMLLRRAGTSVQFWWKPAGGVWTQQASATDSTYQWGMIGAGGLSSGALDNFSGGSLLSVLKQFAPELRLHSQEVYRPDSAATITDNYTATYTNRLQLFDPATFPDFPVNASSDPFAPGETLSLNYLGPSYPSGIAASTSDRIDEANDDRSGDAQRMHAMPKYANRIYGRSVPLQDGGTLLQYWFFYYNNPKTFVTIGDHEGDWEMIQVRLSAEGLATEATYAQHEQGERCSWESVERSASGRPLVYVAYESHASYFWAGDHLIPTFFPYQYDFADGLGESISPSVVEVDALGPQWMQWPGQWGGAESSPHAPPHQIKWSDPVGFEAGANSCSPEPASTDRPGPNVLSTSELVRPPTPSIKARRVGDRVVVSYSFKRKPGTSEPWLLVTTLDSRSDRYSPTDKRTLLRGRMSGTVSQNVHLARGQLFILASARARNGVLSRVVVVPVK